MDVAPARRDDPGGDAAAEPEWVTDRNHPIADLGDVAVAETDIGQRLVGLDLQHRDVGARIAADDAGGVFAVVLKRDLDLGGFADNVVIGDDIAGRVDDEAGAKRDAVAAAFSVRTAAERPRKHLTFATLLAVAAMLIEKAAQVIVEWGAPERLRQPIGEALDIALFRHRDIDHRR